MDSTRSSCRRPALRLAASTVFFLCCGLSCYVLDWSDSASEALGDDDSGTSDGGTWTDTSAGLMWENPPSGVTTDWYSAMDYCDGLLLGGYDDWRVPTIDELRSFVRGCVDSMSDGACGLADSCTGSECWSDACWGCDQGEGPANGCYWPSEATGVCGLYTSSTTTPDYDDHPIGILFSAAWFLDSNAREEQAFLVRCVRTLSGTECETICARYEECWPDDFGSGDCITACEAEFSGDDQTLACLASCLAEADTCDASEACIVSCGL